MNIYFILWVTVQCCLIWLLANIHFCPSSPFSLLHNDLYKKVCIWSRHSFAYNPPLSSLCSWNEVLKSRTWSARLYDLALVCVSSASCHGSHSLFLPALVAISSQFLFFRSSSNVMSARNVAPHLCLSSHLFEKHLVIDLFGCFGS